MGCIAPGTRNKERYGFSLVELLVSVAIVATVLLYIIGIFTSGMKANRKSIDLTAGTLVAESVMTHELYGILSDDDKRAKFFNSSIYSSGSSCMEGTQNLNNTVFTYKLFVTDLPETFGGSNNRLKKVDVQVWWWSDDVGEEGGGSGNNVNAFKQGYGVLSVGLTRIINEQTKY